MEQRQHYFDGCIGTFRYWSYLGNRKRRRLLLPVAASCITPDGKLKMNCYCSFWSQFHYDSDASPSLRSLHQLFCQPFHTNVEEEEGKVEDEEEEEAEDRDEEDTFHGNILEEGEETSDISSLKTLFQTFKVTRDEEE
eukprot:scaffold2159_cov335-Ochromonas_danica.AAC.2